jgi:heme O synthase-like polyprenyltransferase
LKRLKGEIDGEMLRSFQRPVPKADFPEDDGMSQSLLGMVVGRLIESPSYL